MDTETKIENRLGGRFNFLYQFGVLLVTLTIVIMNGNYNTNILSTKLEAEAEKTAKLQAAIDIINTNHLTHIQASMADIQVTLAVLAQKLTDHISQER